MPPVKISNPSRADRAKATRRRLLVSAQGLFVTQGYAATTMEQIASAAGVAVQTVYYSFRTKGRLLCEVLEFATANEEEPAAVGDGAWPWVRESLNDPSPQRALAVAVEHGTDVFERARPLWPAVNAAAAADPEVGQYWRGVTSARRAGQGRLVAHLADLGALREGLEPVRGTDLLVVLFGHDVFGALTEAGWTVQSYKAWLFTSLVQQLLAADLQPSAYQDLSFGPFVSQ